MNILQFLYEGVSFAVKAIGTNKTRAILTMLGVATGIFAITSILTMVNSLKSSITDNLSSLGNTTLFLHNWPWADGSDEWYKFINRPKMSYDEFERLEERLPAEKIEAIYFQATVRGQTAKVNGRSVSGVSVAAITKDVTVIRDFSFVQGRFFSDIEFNHQVPVCIVGFNIAENLFPSGGATGKYIRVRNKRLRVIGVLEKQGGNPFGDGDDDAIMIPYLIGPRLVNMNSWSVDKMIAIKIQDYEEMEYMENEIRGIVRAKRGLKPTVEDNFAINKQEMIMERVEMVFGFLETGGWAISIFSILIGGFSIGLIMYISVRERTNEIGIQKALGSTRNFILFQFLSESVMICLLGGLLGLAFVFLLATGVQFLIDQAGVSMNIRMTFNEISLGLGLSAGCGIIAGFVPALIAALIDPVVAIRHS